MSFYNYDAFLLWWNDEITSRWDDWTPAAKTIDDWWYAFRKCNKSNLTDAVQKHMVADSSKRPSIKKVRDYLNALHPRSMEEQQPVYEQGVDYKSFSQWTREAPKTRKIDFRKQLCRLLPNMYPRIDPEAAKIVQTEDLELQKIADEEYFEKTTKRKEQLMAGFVEPAVKPKRKFDECPEYDEEIPF